MSKTSCVEIELAFVQACYSLDKNAYLHKLPFPQVFQIWKTKMNSAQAHQFKWKGHVNANAPDDFNEHADQKPNSPKQHRTNLQKLVTRIWILTNLYFLRVLSFSDPDHPQKLVDVVTRVTNHTAEYNQDIIHVQHLHDLVG